MARIRSVKPELRRNRRVAEWDIPIRYAWVLLWGYLDDQGRGEDDPLLLKADLFPLDRKITERTVDGWLWTMAGGEDPSLCRYSVGGRDYLHAINWGRHQKISHPTESLCPPCPVHENGSAGEVRSESGSRVSREPLRSDSGGPPEASGAAPPRARGRVPCSSPTVEGAGSRDREPASPAADDDAPEPIPKRANRITTGYADKVQLSNFPAVAKIVAKALNAGHEDQAVDAALGRLARDGRSVTVDTLRIELAQRRPGRTPAPSFTEEEYQRGFA